MKSASNKPSKFLNQHNKAILALIVANIIWGAASPIFKVALQNITPFTLAFIRFFGASLLLVPFIAANPWIDRKDIPKIILLSLFGITINISFFFLGLKITPSINAPIIASAGPVFLYLLSIFILREKSHKKILIGTVISLLGVLLIVGQPIFSVQNTQAIIGNLFFVIATIGSVGHAILSKEILPRYSAILITFWSFLIGSFTFLPLFFYEMVTYHPLATLDGRGILGIIFGIFLSSAVAYFLFEWSVKKLHVQEVGIFTYIDPIVALLIAIPLLGEVVTPIFAIGTFFVFGGIYIAEGRLHYHPLQKLRR